MSCDFKDVVEHHFKYKKVLKQLKELFSYIDDSMKGLYYY
jgi:hypothetical protein